MLSVMRSLHRLGSSFSCLLLFSFIFPLPPSQAIEPDSIRLHGPVSGSGSGQTFGRSVDATEAFTVVGDPRDNEAGNETGAVHVFRTRDGRHLRTLRPSDPEVDSLFGYSVAISGNYVLIGAPSDDALMGSAYVFDVRNGRELMKILSTAAEVKSNFGFAVDLEGTLAAIGASSDDDAAQHGGAVTTGRIDPKAKTFTLLFHGAVAETSNSDSFGASVALSDEHLIAGAPGRDSSTGAAYILNALTGDELEKLTASDGNPLNRFGASVDIFGDRAIVGAPGATGDSTDSGAAYVYHVSNGYQFYKLFEENGQSGDFFGDTVVLNYRTAFIGAPSADDDFDDSGAVFIFQENLPLGNLPTRDRRESDRYGRALACAGNTLVIGAPGKTELPGYAKGAAYLLPLVSLPFNGPVTNVFARKGGSAPDIAEATFRSFPRIQQRTSYGPLVLANLSGRGAPSGQNVGLFAAWDDEWSLRLRTGDMVGPLKVNKISNPVDLYGSSNLLFQIRGTGAGINGGNNEGIVIDDGTALTLAFQEGDELNTGGFSGQQLSTMGPPLGNNEVGHSMFYSKLKSGSATVNRSNDTCALLFDADPFGILTSVIEGTATNLADVDFGQVYTRVGGNDYGMNVVTALKGDGVSPADNVAIWNASPSGAPASLTARKGDPAGGGTVRTFLGEGFSYSSGVYRCSLAGVPGSQNEAIFNDDFSDLICQEGIANPAFPTGVVVSRFLRYFVAYNDTVLLLVKLRGPGVNASNDLAVLYCDDETDWEIMMREGDVAPDTGGARVGRILRLDAEGEYAGYAILVSLVGCSGATNQALYRGDSYLSGNLGLENRIRPDLVLRKGTYQTQLGRTAMIRSIQLPVILERTGAGTRGLGSTIVDKRIITQLTLSDRSVLVAEIE